MPPSSPIDLPEICNLIAEHLPRKAILMCCSVSRDWHNAFLSHLWQSVVLNGAGPIFSNSGTDPRIANIRRLIYNYGTFSFTDSMPTQGYTHLKEFVIDQGGYEGGYDGPWNLLAAIMRTLANGPLSTLEMVYGDFATPEFWEAASQCRLTTLRLNGVYFPFEASSPFWRVCLSVEMLKILNSKSMGCRLVRARMFRLKHLSTDIFDAYSGRDNWGLAKPWICSPNLETLKYCDSVTSIRGNEFYEMVVDIKAAIAAAAEGRNHYELSPDSNGYDECEVKNDEDMEQYCGLIPGRKLHSLETDKHIWEDDLGFLIDNMDTLCKLCVPKVVLGALAVEALIDIAIQS